MDTLARRYGAPDWTRLISRLPIYSPLPLYRLAQDPVFSHGVLQRSVACEALTCRLTGLFHQLHLRPDD